MNNEIALETRKPLAQKPLPRPPRKLFPCYLIAHAGPRGCIVGAAMTLREVVEIVIRELDTEKRKLSRKQVGWICEAAGLTVVQMRKGKKPVR